MKKAIKWVLLIVVVLVLIWSAMAITDYTRSKDLKPPIFAASINLDQLGAGIYHCIGYDVDAYSKAFNGKDHIVYDMRFRLFGRGNDRRRTLSDNYYQNYGLLGLDKETVLNYFEGLEVVEPDISGKQETYTEYVDGNDVKVMNLVLYNGIAAGVEYEYHNLEAAYEYAAKLRKDLEVTYGEKSTYPGMAQTNKEYFDNIKDVSELKSQYKYYENWNAVFDNDKQENIDKMMNGKDYSRIDIHFELSVMDENKATVSVGYNALP